MSPAAPRSFATRHVQIARALFALVAALMITFSSDHSAEVGLSVFSGFAIATGVVWALAAWLVFPAPRRWAPVLLAVLNLAAGMVAGIPAWRGPTLFFVLVIVWAFATAAVEAGSALVERRAGERVEARDGFTAAAMTALLAIVLLVVQPGYVQDYQVEGTHFSLTGVIIGVGIFGGYLAIAAVFLAIAGLSPRRTTEIDRTALKGAQS